MRHRNHSSGARAALAALAIAVVGFSSAWATLDWKIGHLPLPAGSELLRPKTGGGTEIIPGASSATPGIGALIQIIFAGANDLRNPAVNPLSYTPGNSVGTSGDDIVLAVWAIGMIPGGGALDGSGGSFIYPASGGAGASFEGAPLVSGDKIFARVWNLPAGTWTGNAASTIPDFANANLRYVDSATRTVLERANPPNPPLTTQFFAYPLDNIFAADRIADTAAMPIPEPATGLLVLLGAGLALRRFRRD